MHYVVFCMPEISPHKLYFLRKATDPNKYVPVIIDGCILFYRVLFVYQLVLRLQT